MANPQNKAGGWQFTRAAPSVGQVQGVSAVVAAAAESYFQAPGMFAFPRALPYVGCPNLAIQYPKWDKEQVLGRRMKRRAPGAPLDESGVDVEWPTASLVLYGDSFPIADETRMNSQTAPSLETAAVQTLLRGFFSTWEAQFATTFVNAATFGSNAPSAKWDLTASPGDPIAGSMDALETIARKGGNPMNCIGVCSLKVANILRRNTHIRSAVQFGESGGPLLPGMEQIATAMGLREIVVSSAAAGNDSFYFANDHFLILDSPPTKTVEQPSAGMLLGWDGEQGGAPEGIATRLVRDEINGRDLVQVKTAHQMVVQSADLGYRISDVT